MTVKTPFFNVSHNSTPLTLMLGPLQDALNDLSASAPIPYSASPDAAQRNSLRLLAGEHAA
jgi:hypothetical protein